jgi:ATP-dependent Clp protease ATP-binding subunit ClpA
LALDGGIEQLVDFNNSLSLLAQILCRKNKGNAILVGPAGSGKTSIIHNLALQIVQGNAPTLLSGMVVYSVNLASMLAGTQFRGQFEQRLHDFITEAKKYHNLILFFDEIHTLMGAGTNGYGDGLDASNILKPDLTSGRIKVLGATTIDEYRNTIQRDSAMERRFEIIPVQSPNRHQMLGVLRSMKKVYENFHGVVFEEEILEYI